MAFLSSPWDNKLAWIPASHCHQQMESHLFHPLMDCRPSQGRGVGLSSPLDPSTWAVPGRARALAVAVAGPAAPLSWPLCRECSAGRGSLATSYPPGARGHGSPRKGRVCPHKVSSYLVLLPLLCQESFCLTKGHKPKRTETVPPLCCPSALHHWPNQIISLTRAVKGLTPQAWAVHTLHFPKKGSARLLALGLP